MNVVDSSGWLEYFAGTQEAEFFAPAIEDFPHLIVPTLSLFEVFKRILQQRGEGYALQAIAVMHQGRVVGLNSSLALSTARLSVQERLPLADSVMLATAREFGAVLWTQDADFEGLEDVRYRAKELGRNPATPDDGHKMGGEEKP
jgi:predicted nucleic acid-binding protein